MVSRLVRSLHWKQRFAAYCLLMLITVVFGGVCKYAHAANWTVTRLSDSPLDTSAIGATELSGVSYLGPSPTAGKHRFAAVQDSGGQLITLDVEFAANGSLTSAVTVSATTLAASLDFEGAAFTNPARNSVFLSEEDSPGVHEYDLTSGSQLQSVAIPGVFANRVGNRGFESLTRNPAGTTMWTANEEALTVDGALATATTGSPVRLLEMNVVGNTVMTGGQYVYEVDPIHGSFPFGPPQSGLVDLVALPDSTLIGLERSVAAFTSQLYLNRIFEIDIAGATDVSGPLFDSGLIGQTFNLVGKKLLWSGTADGGNGQNLEGLALGPHLANGNWVLLGVVDDGDDYSSNTIVSFELSAIPSADFDEDGDVDGVDFLSWQRGFGISIGALLAEGDADRDGEVASDDLMQWETTLNPLQAAVPPIPEPGMLALVLAVVLAILPQRGWLRAASESFPGP